MDYSYTSSRKGGNDGKVAALSTKELQKKLRELGKSALGTGQVLLKRYDKWQALEAGQEETMRSDAGESGAPDVKSLPKEARSLTYPTTP